MRAGRRHRLSSIVYRAVIVTSRREKSRKEQGKGERRKGKSLSSELIRALQCFVFDIMIHAVRRTCQVKRYAKKKGHDELDGGGQVTCGTGKNVQ